MVLQILILMVTVQQIATMAVQMMQIKLPLVNVAVESQTLIQMVMVLQIATIYVLMIQIN